MRCYSASVDKLQTGNKGMLSEQVRSRLQEMHPDIAIQLDTIIELAPESTD